MIINLLASTFLNPLIEMAFQDHLKTLQCHSHRWYIDSTVLLTPQSKTPWRHCDTAERSLAVSLTSWIRTPQSQSFFIMINGCFFNGKSDKKNMWGNIALLELKSGFEHLVIKNKFCYMDISARLRHRSRIRKHFSTLYAVCQSRAQMGSDFTPKSRDTGLSPCKLSEQLNKKQTN